MIFFNKNGDEFDFDLKIDRFKNRNLSGFTLKANEQDEAKAFCLTFPKSLKNGKGKIKINSHGIWLLNGFYTDVYLPLNEKEAKEFYQFYKAGKKFQLNSSGNPPKFSIIHEN